jgi:hypothetical protein
MAEEEKVLDLCVQGRNRTVSDKMANNAQCSQESLAISINKCSTKVCSDSNWIDNLITLRFSLLHGKKLNVELTILLFQNWVPKVSTTRSEDVGNASTRGK